MSDFVTLLLPCDSARILAGVNNCTTYLKEVLAPILPSSARDSSSSSIFSVLALIDRILMISTNE